MKKTKTLTNTRRMVMTGLCLALGVLLPQLAHFVPLPSGMNAGTVLCPMHLPVLLAGFLAGGPRGLACGVLTPLLSSLLTGMPPLYPTGVSMACELAAYGAASGLLYRVLPKKIGSIYAALVLSMIAGRLVWGVARYLLAGLAHSTFTPSLFLAGAVTSALPGIALHILLIPALVTAMEKAKLILN